MILNEVAMSTLLERIRDPETEASSHWEKYLREFKYDQGALSVPRGAEGHHPRRSSVHQLAHYTLQTPFRRMGARYPNFRKFQRLGHDVVKRRGGLFDLSMMRQVLTLSKLSEHLDLDQLDKPIVIIGDGWGAMTSLVLSCLPRSKVVTINLSKMLLVEMVYTRRAFPDVNICLTRDVHEYQSALADTKVGMVAVCAGDSKLIAQGPIGLAINIASMQEMNPPVIADYFASMRNTPDLNTPFYCCNRIEKTLPDGTVVRFDDYPWKSDDEILLDEICPWHQYFYQFRPPFYKRYDGPHRHRLVMMSKEPRG